MPNIHSLNPLLLTIYPAEPPQQKRTVPMQVLYEPPPLPAIPALTLHSGVGISRSGTESLRTALSQLGYTHCSHGWDLLLPPSFQMLNWWRLARRKHWPRPDDPAWSAKDFDDILGNCRAITDLPAAMFAHELMQAYPDAKIVLNVRKDLDAWYASYEKTLGPLTDNWVIWLAHWFNSELFWIMHVMNHGFLGPFFRGDWRRNAKSVYREHVEGIRNLDLPEERLLEWSVEDGWEPLCEFLGNEVPEQNFPSGNTPADFEQKIDAGMKRLLKAAAIKFLLTLGTAGALAFGVWYALA